MNKIYLLLFLMLLLVLGYVAMQQPHLSVPIHSRIYDATHKNASVKTTTDLNKVKLNFMPLKKEQLAKEFKDRTGYDMPKYLSKVKQEDLYRVSEKHLFKKVAGHHRLYQFLPKDSKVNRAKAKWFKKDSLTVVMDFAILEKLIELQDELKALGHNPNAMSVRNGWRYPHYNTKIGGASASRHLHGDAIDLSIGDINKDGKYTDADKQIVLKLLDEKVIGSNGGVGLYPGTRAVHMDLRGRRARWDSY